MIGWVTVFSDRWLVERYWFTSFTSLVRGDWLNIAVYVFGESWRVEPQRFMSLVRGDGWWGVTGWTTAIYVDGEGWRVGEGWQVELQRFMSLVRGDGLVRGDALNHSGLCFWRNFLDWLVGQADLRAIFRRTRSMRHGVRCINRFTCNGAVECRRTGHRQRSREKWRPKQAYGSNQFLFAQPQTIFSTPKILTRTHRSENGAGRKEHTLSLQ